MNGRRRVVAAIPCLNEAKYIGMVIQRTKPYVDAVYVVDDGSTDGTAQVAEAAGAVVVRHQRNAGPGAAARTCLEVARSAQADILVTLDGDGQHDPQDVSKLVTPVLEEEADLVIGSRFLGTPLKIPRYRRFGIGVITWLSNLGAGEKLSDAQSCFRAYGPHALQALSISDNGFGFSVETLAQARRAGLRIREVPISCAYHQDGSTLNPVRHGVGVALAVLKHRLRVALARSSRPSRQKALPSR